MHTLPLRELEANGRPAYMVSFRGVSDGAEMDVIIDRETFRVIGIHEAQAHAQVELQAV
jgi:hypothetical protein